MLKDTINKNNLKSIREILRQHLIEVANWTLFRLRTHHSTPSPVSAALAGEPGVTPGPVEMDDPRNEDEPLASW